MPPEPLPWDRKEAFRDRKQQQQQHEFPSVPPSNRWRDSSPYVGSRNNNNNNDFSPRFGFQSSDYRRPPGHGKQGMWHTYSEDRGYSTPRSNDRFLDDDVFRPSGMRGDGRYSRSYRDNRPSSVHKDCRGNSWEPNHHHSASANGLGRPHVNDQRLVSDSPMRASHPHSDPCDQVHAKDQVDKMSDANGTSTAPKVEKEKVEKENTHGSLDWKPLKWSRSGSLTSRGSGFSHSSSSKSMGGESSDVKCDLPPKIVTPVQSPSGDAVACVPSVVPSEETSSRKKPRLGWGEGLAKYEKKKGPEDNFHNSGNPTLVCIVEPSNSVPTNLVNKSPKVAGFSDCSSPATPSSFACSSSPGLEDKSYGKSIDADGDASNFCVSSKPVTDTHPEGSHFSLDKLELKSIGDLESLITKLLQADDHSLDSGFTRSSAFNKLLLWKNEISKTLELTECEIDSLENELTSLKSHTIQSFHRPASSNSGPAECKDGPSDGLNNFPRPQPLEVVSSGHIMLEDRLPFDDAKRVQDESKDEDMDSPGTATSKFVDPPIQKSASSETCNYSSLGVGLIESIKRTTENLAACNDETDVGTSSQGHDRNVVQNDKNLSIGIEYLDMCDKEEDNVHDTIVTSNKESASRAAEVLFKLMPSDGYSLEAKRVACLPADSIVKEKYLKRKRSLRFKERVLSMKYRAFHHLWKEDLRLLSLRTHRTKPQKKLDVSSRTLQIGSQKHRSSIRSRFASPAGSLSLVPTTEIINFTGKLLSETQVEVCRSSLKMPAMILDEREKKSRFVSSNGLVEDPCAVEKQRALINPWSFEEKEIFMDKLSTHGKDFRKIASFLDHKTTADCIEFYYKNHKSECFEKIKKLDVKKQAKPLSSNTYLLTSGKKWSREMNAASLDILGAASVIAAQADQAMESSKSLLGKTSSRKSRGSDGFIEASNSMYGAEDERETTAADVLAGICGSLSSEAMSSCITSSVDPGEGNHDRKQQKVSSSIRRPLTPEVTQNFDDDTCSDESCGEMDPADWTDDEKSLFVRAFSSHGKDFSMISRCVRTKSRDQCKVFFSKARKCLGLDNLHTGSGGGGVHVSNDTNEGGSDTEDAGIVETGSVVCSDKSGSRMDEDLLHINQDVSKPESGVAELNMLEENCGLGQLNCKDAGLKLEGLVPHDHRTDVSELGASGGIVDAETSEVQLLVEDDKSNIKKSSDKIDPKLLRTSSDAMDMKGASGISDSKSEMHASSVPVEFACPGNGLFRSSTVGDRSLHHLLSGSFMKNQSEFPRDFKGFPLDLSIKADLHDVVTHTVGSESIAHSFQKSYLRRCSRTASHHSVTELPLLQHTEDDIGSTSKTEKPCRNGDVKLFGKILSKPSVDKPCNATVHDDKARSSSSGSKFDAKLAANQDDQTSFLGLENVPIRSYGFWDGTKIQTGFSSLPDSAYLLAKYPGAFSNYSASSPKSEHPLPSVAVNGSNECNMNGACVFSPREFSSNNGGSVIDYSVLNNQDRMQPFRLDMKQRTQEVVFPEVQRNGFETVSSLQQPEKGLVKLNVVQGGGACAGISDPVAALKLHYASQQYGGGGSHAVNGIIREESWRGKGGDLGR